MKTVLIVDDERPFLLSLKDGLERHSDKLDIVLAGNGLEAAGVFAQRQVDLLVTDLKLPQMNGFELLAHVGRTHPQVPVIVMTAFGTPEMESRISDLGALTYLEKPLSLPMLEQSIFSALESGARSFIHGITLAAFLQLLHLEKKSCSLRVKSRECQAELFIQRGELIDAEFGDLDGTAAALTILGWDDAEIEMENVCKRRERLIDDSLEYLLMEAFRHKDEQRRPAGETSQPKAKAAPISSPASAEQLLAGGPLAAPLASMQELLGKVLGPMAKIVFPEAVEEWLLKHKPIPTTLPQLADILCREIGDAQRARAYRQMLVAHFKPVRR